MISKKEFATSTFKAKFDILVILLFRFESLMTLTTKVYSSCIVTVKSHNTTGLYFVKWTYIII